MQTLFAFIFVFGIIVMVHEFGHFYFAKRAGILVREFAIGMGPKIFQTHRNETTYTIRALPIGGYVMMAGYEEEEDIRLGMPALLVLDEEEQVKDVLVPFLTSDKDLNFRVLKKSSFVRMNRSEEREMN